MEKKSMPSYVGMLILALITIASCKKAETTEADDPNITYKSFNRTTEVLVSSLAIDSIDINQDGLSELLYIIQNLGADTGVAPIYRKNQLFEVELGSNTPGPYVKLYSKNELPSTSNSLYSPDGYLSVKASGYRLGLIDDQEKYFAFRFSTGIKYQYGWMKVQINSAYTQLKISEYAYSTLFDTPIKTGAK